MKIEAVVEVGVKKDKLWEDGPDELTRPMGGVRPGVLLQKPTVGLISSRAAPRLVFGSVKGEVKAEDEI